MKKIILYSLILLSCNTKTEIKEESKEDILERLNDKAGVLIDRRDSLRKEYKTLSVDDTTRVNIGVEMMLLEDTLSEYMDSIKFIKKPK